MAYDFHARLRRNGVRFKEINAEVVTYTRNGVTLSDDLVLSPTQRKSMEMTAWAGAIIRVDEMIWGCDVADLGADFPPIEGDKIVRSTGEEHRVLKPQDDDSVYCFVDAEHTRVLIHSKRSKKAT